MRGSICKASGGQLVQGTCAELFVLFSLLHLFCRLQNFQIQCEKLKKKKKKDTNSCRAPGIVQGSLPDGGEDKLSSEEKLLTEQEAVAQAGLTLEL